MFIARIRSCRRRSPPATLRRARLGSIGGGALTRPTEGGARRLAVPGRTLVERVTLFLFVAALSAVAVVFLSRGRAEVRTQRASSEPTRVSQALAATREPATPTPGAGPTLAEILVAADQVQRAQDFYTRIMTPTPTLAEILIAADQVQRAQDFFERIATPTPGAGPTLAEILIAADQVQPAPHFFERTSQIEPEPTMEEILKAADQLT